MNGGADTVVNIVAFCSSFHGNMRVLDDQADRKLLVARLNAQ